jgi:hypothetical protein
MCADCERVEENFADHTRKLTAVIKEFEERVETLLSDEYLVLRERIDEARRDWNVAHALLKRHRVSHEISHLAQSSPVG